VRQLKHVARQKLPKQLRLFMLISFFFFLFRSEVQIELTKIEQGRIEINLLRLNTSAAVLGHVYVRIFTHFTITLDERFSGFYSKGSETFKFNQ
jgi:hypothetical protein